MIRGKRADMPGNITPISLAGRHARRWGKLVSAVLCGVLAMGLCPVCGQTGSLPPARGKAASKASGDVGESYLRAITRLHGGDIDRGIMNYYSFLLQGQSLLSVAVRRSDLRTAQEHLASRMRRSPQDSRMRLFVPMIERMIERWPEALKQLDALLAQSPKSAVLTFLKGELLLECQKTDQARELFGRLAGMPNGHKLAKLAQILVSRQGLTAASDPEVRHQFLLSAGYRQWDLMARDSARVLFETAMREFPDDPQPARALVDMCLEVQQPLEAEKIVASWTARHGKPLLELQQTGRLAIALGRYDEAIPALCDLMRQDPDDVYARFQLAEACYQCDRYDEALLHFKRLFEGDPNNVGFAQRYAECLLRTGDLEAALSFFSELAKAKPDIPYYRIELASINIRLGQFEDAKSLLTELSTESGVSQKLVGEMMETVDAKLAEEAEKIRRASEAATDAFRATASSASDPFSSDVSNGETLKRVGVMTIGEARRLAQMYE